MRDTFSHFQPLLKCNFFCVHVYKTDEKISSVLHKYLPLPKKLTWKTRILQFELHVGQSSRQMWDIFSPLWNPLFSAILIVQLWAQKRNSAKVVWISDKTKVHFLLGFRTPGVPPMLVTLAPFQGETCQISSLSLSDSNSEWKKSRRYFFLSLLPNKIFKDQVWLLCLETGFLQDCSWLQNSLCRVSKHFKSPTEKWKEENWEVSSESHKMENFCCSSTQFVAKE